MVQAAPTLASTYRVLATGSCVSKSFTGSKSPDALDERGALSREVEA